MAINYSTATMIPICILINGNRDISDYDVIKPENPTVRIASP